MNNLQFILLISNTGCW